MSCTLCIIKPDAIINGKTEEILKAAKDNGLYIVYKEMRSLSKEIAEKLYAEHKEKEFYNGLVEFITSGDVMLVVLSASDAVAKWREVMVKIREDFGTDITKNAVHGSDSDSSAKKEFEIMFDKPVLATIETYSRL